MWNRIVLLKRIKLLIYAGAIYLACPVISSSQTLVIDKSSPATDSILHTTIALIHNKHFEKLPIGDRIAAIGKLFLGKPYIDKSLEVGNDVEEVVCNLEGFDCVTFFESIWALARLANKHSSDTSNLMFVYGDELARTRYRERPCCDYERGQPPSKGGFQSRLHYTSDYFYRNANLHYANGELALLQEMTKEIGGSDAKLEKKPINFMTSHPSLYKQLKDDPSMVAKMDSIEKMINARGGFYYIPKEDVEDNEKGIHTGDLIGITTSIPGIDCSHTGIAIREKDGRVHFMHASSAMHKVIISPMPLADYLAGNSKQTGIMIYRPLEPK
jgi:hypothetical protein